mmetsp:Transcript_32680/g.81940  ORF Transcript_32680/g.81940 Transcript_32680/m.81940 type:complete len:292 (+) Transcript_32680:257-1132(+)
MHMQMIERRLIVHIGTKMVFLDVVSLLQRSVRLLQYILQHWDVLSTKITDGLDVATTHNSQTIESVHIALIPLKVGHQSKASQGIEIVNNQSVCFLLVLEDVVDPFDVFHIQRSNVWFGRVFIVGRRFTNHSPLLLSVLLNVFLSGRIDHFGLDRMQLILRKPKVLIVDVILLVQTNARLRTDHLSGSLVGERFLLEENNRLTWMIDDLGKEGQRAVVQASSDDGDGTKIAEGLVRHHKFGGVSNILLLEFLLLCFAYGIVLEGAARRCKSWGCFRIHAKGLGNRQVAFVE